MQYFLIYKIYIYRGAITGYSKVPLMAKYNKCSRKFSLSVIGVVDL